MAWQPNPTGWMLAQLNQRLLALQIQLTLLNKQNDVSPVILWGLQDSIHDVQDDIAIITGAALTSETGAVLRSETGHVLTAENSGQDDTYPGLTGPAVQNSGAS